MGENTLKQAHLEPASGKIDPFDSSLELDKATGRFNKKNMKLIFVALGAVMLIGLSFSLSGGSGSTATKEATAEKQRLEAKPDKSLTITNDDYVGHTTKVEALPMQVLADQNPVITPTIGRADPTEVPTTSGQGYGNYQVEEDGRGSSLFFEASFQSGQDQIQSSPPMVGSPNYPDLGGLLGQQPVNYQQFNQAYYNQSGYGYLDTPAQNAIAYGNEIKAGTIIPLTMVTGINSDLPGDIKGQITRDIYDSITGRNLLIPKGSVVVGNYNSTLAFGQTRLMVAWQRLIRPDGVSLELQGMSGTEGDGMAGITGKVNNHYDKIFKAAGLASLFDVGLNATKAGLSSVQFLKNLDKFNQASGSNGSTAGMLADQGKSVFEQYAQQVINQPPTIIVQAGVGANLFVNKDMILPTATSGR